MTAQASWHSAYMRRYYDPDRGWRNGTEEFHELCAAEIGAGAKILELGAGPSNATSRFLATLGPLYGLDPDPDVRQNDALVSAELLQGERFPFDDESFDACVSNYVIEHVADPARHLAEVRRVLRPGGPYVFRTPSLWHYVSLASALTSHRFHLRVANRLRGRGPESPDPYPTVYRLNTAGAVRRRAREAGLDVAGLRMVEKEPSYGAASRVLFLAFMCYERVVNASELTRGLRANIFGVLRRPV